MPYRLAIPQLNVINATLLLLEYEFNSFLFYVVVSVKWLGYLDSNQGMPGSKPGALPLGDTPPETTY